jgi:protein-tyrosine phosphatase
MVGWRSLVVIDIHSHVLWDVDDGASSLQESVAMLRASAADGVTDIVATPHYNQQYSYDPEVVEARIAELADAEKHPKIHRGCEFHLTFDNLDRLLQSPAAFTINASRFLLLECPDRHIGRHTESILQRLVDTGLIPILAHPERNPTLQKDLDRLERWVDLGSLSQVTSLSITGGFGSQIRSAAAKILERGLAHIVASDAHDPDRRSPRMSAARETVCRAHGEEAADLLFSHNPRCVIQNLPVAGGKLISASPRSRRWWPF